MNYSGRIFRPPSEAYSLIIQATIGCSHNRCRFCDMYKEKQFHIRPLEAILSDLDASATYYPRVNRIFLADGDALIMHFSHLEAILNHATALWPNHERVTCYATPKSVNLKSLTELSTLRSLGLTMVYMGLESGSDTILTHVDKGSTAAEMIAAAQKLHAAGIALSVTAISGLGGTAHWQEHAQSTGEVLSAMKAAYIGLLTFRLEGQAPMVQEVEQGDFVMLTPLQVATETRLLLSYLDSEGSIFRANHISNYINLAGTLNRDRQQLINALDAALAGQIPFKSEEYRNWDVTHQ